MRTLCVSAVLTVLDEEATPVPSLEAALLICGNNTETSVGGNVTASVVDAQL
jgi:hypothetical protein